MANNKKMQVQKQQEQAQDLLQDIQQEDLLQEQAQEQVFWQYITADDEGVTIKVYNKAKQAELRKAVEDGNKKFAEEQQKKKQQLEAVKLADVEAFDTLVSKLIADDSVYVITGKRTGRNLGINYADKTNKTSKKTSNKTTVDRPAQAIHVDAQFEF